MAVPRSLIPLPFPMPRRLLLMLLPLFLALLLALWLGPQAYRYLRTRSYRFGKLGEWFGYAQNHPDWSIQGGTRCGNAVFTLPTSGYLGFLWDDSFKFGQRHQGIDTFGGTDPGVTPVVAAYSGYLTRRPDWKSTLAIRIPSDPLQPGRQIWLYYTHMAMPDGSDLIDDAFPPGTAEAYVEAGALLGTQGNYSGDPGNPTGVHLHFSIVLDDGNGFLRNELNIRNTLDPSPYLGLQVNANRAGKNVPVCAVAP
jgi:murein DD-endopeptidase MepM/ murein hydrolase activator NlpD